MSEALRTLCCAALRVIIDLSKDSLVQHEIRDRFPKPDVLLLHILKPLCLMQLEVAIPLTPSIVSLLSYPESFGCSPNALALARFAIIVLLI